MKRVLVTGAQGLLGSSLVPHLISCGYEVIRHARKGDVEVRFDLTDADETSAALDKFCPEAIINLVALANVDACERCPQDAYLANVRTVENIAAWIKRRGNCHLIQISSDQVYDGEGLNGEGDLRLTNYYAFSKYAGELAAATVPSTVLRTNFFGQSRCPGRKSLSDWIIDSLIRGESITVFEDVHFSPLNLDHLIQFIACVLSNPKPGVFNLGSKDGMSKAEFAFAVAETLQLPTKTMQRGCSETVKLAAYRPKNMCMDLLRFETAFGVTLPSLREEIRLLRREL